MTKKEKINFGLVKIERILDCVDDSKQWNLLYSDSERGEYIFIFDNEGNRLYSVNVSADNVLTALSELMSLLSKKY